MAKIEESVKKQLTKLIVTFLKYYPVRIRNVGEKEKQSRQIVWDFKDGREFENVAQETAQHFKEHFGDNRNDIVFACVPASTAEKNELRFKKFSARVCELTGATNGYEHIHILADRQTVHDHRKTEGEIRKTQNVELDTDFLQTRKCLFSMMSFHEVCLMQISPISLKRSEQRYWEASFWVEHHTE